MKSNITKKTQYLRAFLAMLLLASLSTTEAATILTEPFTSPEGGVPAGWVVRKRSGTSAVAEIAPYSSTDALLIQRPTSGNGGSSNSNAAVFFTGSNGDIIDGTLANFTGQITMSLSDVAGGSSRGVALRAQTDSYAYSGYYASISSTGLRITLSPTSHTDNGTLLVESDFSQSLASNTEYQLTFSAIGKVLSASLFLDSTQLATVSVDLSEGDNALLPYYSSGYFGVRGGYGSATSTYFSDLTLTTVPEPSVVGLAGLAGFVMIWRFRRRRI